MIVLDGLERLLVAYNRLDASQARDDQVSSDRDDRSCIKPQDTDVLRQLVNVGPSKILVTSQLVPTALTNRTGQLLPSVGHHQLGGLHTSDALAMMRILDVRGDEETICRYLENNFGNHSLVLGVVAGLVRDYPRDPGNFSRWVEDPQGGAALALSQLDLSQRRVHILGVALDGLERGARQLLSRLATLSGAVPFETLEALNPFLPEPPHGRAEADMGVFESSEDYRQALPKLVSTIQDLERRGLLQWDRQRNSYDLHPVVRGYAFDALEEGERIEVSNRVVDYFQSRPGDRYDEAKTLADVQQSINIFRVLIQAGRFNEAAEYYGGRFAQTVYTAIEAYHETLKMLQPLFVDGFQHPPTRVTEKQYQSYLLGTVAIALDYLDRSSEAIGTEAAALRINLDENDYHNVRRQLINLSTSFFHNNQFYRASAALALAFQTSTAIGDNELISTAYLHTLTENRRSGLFDKAESANEAFQGLPVPTNRDIYRPGEFELEVCWLRFHQGTLTHEMLNDALLLAESGNNRGGVRSIHRLHGELALLGRNAIHAILALEKSLEMSREAGIPAYELEGRLALAKALSGDHAGANETAARLEDCEIPPHTALAELYMELGQQLEAQEHVLKGYRRAWSDGPPYADWWELARCRAVLGALGEPEPVLPPFDPAKIEPIPYESEIRAVIDKLNAEKGQR